MYGYASRTRRLRSSAGDQFVQHGTESIFPMRNVLTQFIVNDEKYDPREPSSAYAYGPRVVYKLAQRSLNQMGGAERASTNADSYAWLANSKQGHI